VAPENAILARMMIKPRKKPDMTPRELKGGSAWYVLVTWGDWPSEQVGGCRTEKEAQQWIEESSPGWLDQRFEEPPFA